MSGTKKKPAEVVTKPYLTGAITDENLFKNILKYFGMTVLFLFVAFIVSAMSGFGGQVVQIIFNGAIVLLMLYIYFTRGISLGTDAVAYGEILYQRKEKGAEMTENERKLSYHPLKGFLIALLGMLPVLIPAVILAFVTKRQVTSIGTIPSWVSSMARRSEIGDALVTYTQPEPMHVADYLRVFVRMCLMPVFRMINSEDRGMMLVFERISALLLLLPVISFGCGYLMGPGERTKIHTRIAENRKIRARKEKREKKARMAAGDRNKTEQLN